MPESNFENEPEYGVPDEENPEWTKEDFRRAKRIQDIPELQGLWQKLQAEQQGEALNDRKVITLQVPMDVADAMEASGPDWQERAEEALRFAFRKRA